LRHPSATLARQAYGLLFSIENERSPFTLPRGAFAASVGLLERSICGGRAAPGAE
jgi:hypothetical protein